MEEDIVKLCNQVINLNAVHDSDGNGYDYYYCPICYEEIIEDRYTSMSDIKHKLDCGYLIAKDLMTNKTVK